MRWLRLVPMYLAASTLALIGLTLLWLLPGHVGYYACCIEVHPSGLPLALVSLLLATGLFLKRRTAQLGAIALCLVLVSTTVAGNLTWTNVMWGALVQSAFTLALVVAPMDQWRPAKLGLAEYVGIGLAGLTAALVLLVPGYPPAASPATVNGHPTTDVLPASDGLRRR